MHHGWCRSSPRLKAFQYPKDIRCAIDRQAAQDAGSACVGTFPSRAPRKDLRIGHAQSVSPVSRPHHPPKEHTTMRGATQSTPVPGTGTMPSTSTSTQTTTSEQPQRLLDPGTPPNPSKRPRLPMADDASDRLLGNARKLRALNEEIESLQAAVGYGTTTPELQAKKIERAQLMAACTPTVQPGALESGQEAESRPLTPREARERLAIDTLNGPNGLQKLMTRRVVIPGFDPESPHDMSPELQMAFLSASVRTMQAKRDALLLVRPLTRALLDDLRRANTVIMQSSQALSQLKAARRHACEAIASRQQPCGTR
jgi:hypothetical protein